MTMICSSIPRDKVRDADIVLGKLGISHRFQAIIDDIDFDPDAVQAKITALQDAAEVLQASPPEDCSQLFAETAWAGAAKETACDDVECQRTFWDHVIDFLLWMAENLIQLLDYIVDGLRVIVAWITWLATAIALLLLVIDIILMGPAAAIAAAVESPILAILGTVALVGALVSIILVLINMLLEWLETIIRDARSKICGKGLPSLPDWDPSGPWFPPAWPT